MQPLSQQGRLGCISSPKKKAQGSAGVGPKGNLKASAFPLLLLSFQDTPRASPSPPPASPFFSFLAAHCRKSCFLCHSALGRKRLFINALAMLWLIGLIFCSI